MSKGLGSIDRDISTIETAYAGNPQALSSKIQRDKSRGVSQSLLELMALEKMNAEKEAIKNQMILDSPQGIETVADQVKGTAKNNAEQEILSGVAKALAMKQSARQKRANQLLKTPTNRLMAGTSKPMMDPRTVGLGKIRRPNFQKAATGGIIGYNEAGLVEKIISGAKNVGSNIKEKLGNIVESDEFKAYKAKLKEKFGSTVDAISNSELVESFLKGGSDLIDNVTETAGPIIENVKKGGVDFLEDVKEGAGPVIENIKEKAGPIISENIDFQKERLANLGKFDGRKYSDQRDMVQDFVDFGGSLTGLDDYSSPGLFVKGFKDDTGKNKQYFKYPSILPKFMKYDTDEMDADDLREAGLPANFPEKVRMGIVNALDKVKNIDMSGLEEAGLGGMGQDPVGLAAIDAGSKIAPYLQKGVDIGKSAIEGYLDPNFPSNESKENFANFMNENVIKYDPTGLLPYIDPKSTASPEFDTTGKEQLKQFGSNLKQSAIDIKDFAVDTFESLANVFFPESKPEPEVIEESVKLITENNSDDLVELSTTELIEKKEVEEEVNKELNITENDVIDTTKELDNTEIESEDGGVASIYDPERMININDPKGGSDQTNAGLAELVEKAQNKKETTEGGTKAKVTTANTGSLNSSTSIADAYMKAINDLKGKRSKLDRLIYKWGNFRRTGRGLGGSGAAAGLRYDAFLDEKDQAVLGKFFDFKMQEFKINATLAAARARAGGVGGLKGIKELRALNTANMNITKALGERSDAIKETPDYMAIQNEINRINGTIENMRASRDGYETTREYTSLLDELTVNLNAAKALILNDPTYIMLTSQIVMNENLINSVAGSGQGDIDTDTDPVEVE